MNVLELMALCLVSKFVPTLREVMNVPVPVVTLWTQIMPVAVLVSATPNATPNTTPTASLSLPQTLMSVDIALLTVSRYALTLRDHMSAVVRMASPVMDHTAYVSHASSDMTTTSTPSPPPADNPCDPAYSGCGSAYCANINTSYYCYCDAGFTININGTSCDGGSTQSLTMHDMSLWFSL